MSSPAPVISLAMLTAQPTFDSNTISLYLQISFSTGGYYSTGGVASGVAAFAAALSIDTSQFLFAEINSEVTLTTSPAVGGYLYQYNPATDKIQIIGTGAGNGQALGELASSAGIGASTLNDVVIGKFTWNRL